MWVYGIGSGTLSGILNVVGFLAGQHWIRLFLFFKGYRNL